MISFKGAQFPKEVIFFAVLFYVRYTVSYRYHPQFVCHGLTELHRLRGSGRGIEKTLGSHQQGDGG